MQMRIISIKHNENRINLIIDDNIDSRRQLKHITNFNNQFTTDIYCHT